MELCTWITIFSSHALQELLQYLLCHRLSRVLLGLSLTTCKGWCEMEQVTASASLHV